ncbi:MAG: L-carnitine dehydratase/bile acid-inducible protein [Microbacteriaceae bacterium]|jgi:hypothetical protein|nr:L-carnitine dehydratase/bile acid-inducible protein [Microbacteriaceae bacterium]
MDANPHEAALLVSFGTALGLAPGRPARFEGHGTLTSAFAVNELAAASIAAAGLAASELLGGVADVAAAVAVDRSLATAWFGTALAPVGWELPSPWDALAGDYESADGWIRLHTNAPHHRAVAVTVLGVGTGADRERVARAVRRWAGDELEAAVVAAGGCAAVMRGAGEWAQHPQGRAVSLEPLVVWDDGEPSQPSGLWRPTGPAPLVGLRVLDFTRVIAGPVATRVLAGLGADVLRVDPPDWNEPAVTPEMTLGKRSARVDAVTTVGRDALERLIAGADVMVHGYRPGALDGLVSAKRRRELRPGLVEVALDAYGWSGPWHERRGFDSLVQMSSGIAEEGMRWAAAARPVPLPVQALDHATGYLAAAAALVALNRVRRDGVASGARVSLARMAAELLGTSGSNGYGAEAAATREVATPWGRAVLLESPLVIGDTRLEWRRGPRELGSDEPRW